MFYRLDELDLTVVGQKLEPDRAVLTCRVAEDPTALDPWCWHCGCEGRPRDTVTRELAHEPSGWRPTTLLVTIRRYRCTGCGRIWRHTRRSDKFVTVVIVLTPVRERTGPSRLLDMVEGHSKQAFKTRLCERPKAWRDGLEVVAMDGFTGFKTATTEELPDAVAVMDPFHVVRLWPATPWTAAGAASSRTYAVTKAARTTRSTAPAGPCTPAKACSPTANASD